MEGDCQIGTLGVALLESVLNSDSAPRLVFMGVHSFDFSIFIEGFRFFFLQRLCGMTIVTKELKLFI